jgi:hypothetical protein
MHGFVADLIQVGALALGVSLLGMRINRLSANRDQRLPPEAEKPLTKAGVILREGDCTFNAPTAL